jgi:Recombinase
LASVPCHHILTNTVYVGHWQYNVGSAKTGELKPASEIVEIATPTIVEQDLFDRVQARLVANNPKVTAPRVVTGLRGFTEGCREVGRIRSPSTLDAHRCVAALQRRPPVDVVR